MSEVGSCEVAEPVRRLFVHSASRIPDVSCIGVENGKGGGFPDLFQPGQVVKRGFIQPEGHLEHVVVTPKAEGSSLRIEAATVIQEIEGHDASSRIRLSAKGAVILKP
jgi:hypothetical protein